MGSRSCFLASAGETASEPYCGIGRGMQLCSEPALVHIMIHCTQGPASAALLSVCPQFMTLLRSQEVLFGTTHCSFLLVPERLLRGLTRAHGGTGQSPWWYMLKAEPGPLHPPHPTACAEGAGKPLLQAWLILCPALNF